ncbi:hypothetical protein B296_00050220 [Ensete ventricosum]|uniref:Uncharacterized protein n=1 Tax=Ensete ventricosum TaxID=4639 RepID=A0A426WVJ4_ENSVE|nr:hypothetical protein B296_00050220 [Ensete ventricosum]
MIPTEAFFGLAHKVQALTGMIQAIIPHIPQLASTTAPPQPEPPRPPNNQGGTREHSMLVRLGPVVQDPPETRSEAPSIILWKSATLYLEVEHTPQEPDTLSSDSTGRVRFVSWALVRFSKVGFGFVRWGSVRFRSLLTASSLLVVKWQQVSTVTASFYRFRPRADFVIDSCPSTVTTSTSATDRTNEINTDLPASSNPFLRSRSR